MPFGRLIQRVLSALTGSGSKRRRSPDPPAGSSGHSAPPEMHEVTNGAASASSMDASLSESDSQRIPAAQAARELAAHAPEPSPSLALDVGRVPSREQQAGAHERSLTRRWADASTPQGPPRETCLHTLRGRPARVTCAGDLQVADDTCASAKRGTDEAASRPVPSKRGKKAAGPVRAAAAAAPTPPQSSTPSAPQRTAPSHPGAHQRSFRRSRCLL